MLRQTEDLVKYEPEKGAALLIEYSIGILRNGFFTEGFSDALQVYCWDGALIRLDKQEVFNKLGISSKLLYPEVLRRLNDGLCQWPAGKGLEQSQQVLQAEHILSADSAIPAELRPYYRQMVREAFTGLGSPVYLMHGGAVFFPARFGISLRAFRLVLRRLASLKLLRYRRLDTQGHVVSFNSRLLEVSRGNAPTFLRELVFEDEERGSGDKLPKRRRQSYLPKSHIVASHSCAVADL